MSKSINYKIFVLNLDRSPDRLDFMTKQFEALRLPFEREIAIEGKTYDFSHDYDDELYRKFNKGTTASGPVKGCALSHRHALERMLSEGLDYAVILEDDIELRNDFKEILEEELNKRASGKSSWEYLSFNYPGTGWKSIHLWLFLFFHASKNKIQKPTFWITLPYYLLKFLIVSIFYSIEGVRETVYKALFKHGKPAYFLRPLYLAGCYIVTREGAQKLIELNTPIAFTADGLPNAARIKRHLKFFAYVPLVARQKREAFESTLFNGHFGKKVTTY